MAELTITKENFEKEVMESTIPVLVDFWAPWCGPCRMLAPAIEEIAEEYEGQIKVGKINVDQEGSLAMKFNVASIPTLILFRNGEIADTKVGFMPKDEIEEMLK